jgi:hypothetical protein
MLNAGDERGRRVAVRAVLVALVGAALVYAVSGFQGMLNQDDAVYVYGGQQFVDGVPPYVGIFERKGPLGTLLCGLGVAVGRLTGIDDLLAARYLFFLISAGAAAGVLLLGRATWRSLHAGGLAAATFVGFHGFARHATYGPRPKTAMVLCEVLALLFCTHRSWFLAGVCGALAGLAWQPAGVFGLVVPVVAWLQEERAARVRAAARAAAGVALPLVLAFLYFLANGAVAELWEGAVSANMDYVGRRAPGLLNSVLEPLRILYVGYPHTGLVIIVGLAIVPALFWVRARCHGGLRPALRNDPAAALYLTLPAPLIWSMIDIQGYPDLYVLLPYAAIGFGGLLDAGRRRITEGAASATIQAPAVTLALYAALVGGAVVQRRLQTNAGLGEQRERLARIVEGLGPDARIASVGSPAALVLAGRTQHTRYLYVRGGIDDMIEDTEPGGVRGWLESFDEAGVQAVFLGRTLGKHAGEIEAFLAERFELVDAAPWKLRVRPERAAAVRAALVDRN